MGFLDGLGSLVGDIAPIAGPIGSVASSVLGGMFQQHANTATANMASTQYQRGVTDLKAAGLNPAMAYGGIANAAPTMQPAATAQSINQGLSGAIDAYNQIQGGIAQRRLQTSQANAADTNALVNNLTANTLQPGAQAGVSTDYQAQWKAAQLAGFAATEQQAANIAPQFKASIANTNAQTANAQAQARLNDSQTTLNEQNFTNTWFRQNLQPYINSTAATIKPFQSFLQPYMNWDAQQAAWNGQLPSSYTPRPPQ